MEHSEIGKKGEDIACEFLEQKGHVIIDRNFLMKFGEIDVVSKKGGKFYFSEVKTIANEDGSSARSYRPEERVDLRKIRKLSHVIEHYLSNKLRDEEAEWEFWVIAVTLDTKKMIAKVKVIPETIGA